MTRAQCFVTAILLFGGLITASAQTYPDKTIKFIVPYTPGSPVDAGARVIAQDLQKRLGQSVILEGDPAPASRPGPRPPQRPRLTATHCC